MCRHVFRYEKTNCLISFTVCDRSDKNDSIYLDEHTCGIEAHKDDFALALRQLIVDAISNWCLTARFAVAHKQPICYNTPRR